MFSKSFLLTVIKKYGKSALTKILLVLEPFNVLTVEGCFETVLNSERCDQHLDGR